MSVSDHVIAQWFETALTEREAHALVGHVKGALHYRTVVSWAILPEPARDIIRRAHAEAVSANQ